MYIQSVCENILFRSVLCVYVATVFVSTCMLCTKIASKLLHKDYVFTVVWAEISDSQHNMSHACAVYKYMICMIQALMPVESVCVPL